MTSWRHCRDSATASPPPMDVRRCLRNGDLADASGVRPDAGARDRAVARVRDRLPADRGVHLRPPRQTPVTRQASAFLLPGALLVVLALLNLGFWCGGWLLGLPAWGLLLSRSTTANPIRAAVVLKFFGLLVLGLAVFTFNIMWVIFSLGLFLLPIVPLLRLPHPEYRTRPLQTAAEVLLAVAAVVIAVAIPTPEGSWSSPWVYAGGAATAGLMITYWAWSLPRRSRRPQLNSGVIV